ncbi:MAG: arsenate reductase (glutaredoxin) [Pseudohongiellaceae bacterium]
MMQITIWHNPRCSKSRETLSLLQERGIEPSVRLYLEDAPGEGELRDVIDRLGLRAIDLVRTKEVEFRDSGLNRKATDDELIAAMVKHPKLIERPVVMADGKAVLGRPPEKVLDIL